MNEQKTTQELITEFGAAYVRFMVALGEISERLSVESTALFPTLQQMCDDFEAAAGMSLEQFHHLPKEDRAALVDGRDNG